MSGDAHPVGAFSLWPLALPLLGELLIIAFGTFSEVFFLGRVGLDAVAAYGIVAPVLLLCIVFLRLSAQGAGAVLSRYRGSADMGRVAAGQRLALAVSTLLGLVLAGGLGLREQIFSLMGASGQILVYAQQYALGWSVVIAVSACLVSSRVSVLLGQPPVAVERHCASPSCAERSAPCGGRRSSCRPQPRAAAGYQAAGGPAAARSRRSLSPAHA
ncbi:MATE family efflux transporter [Streptomyces shenzhenensis]